MHKLFVNEYEEENHQTTIPLLQIGNFVDIYQEYLQVDHGENNRITRCIELEGRLIVVKQNLL